MRYWRTGEIPFLDKPAQPDTVVAQPAEPEPAEPAVQKPKEEVDDSELVAVVTAAIASLEKKSTDSFVVRSIKRR